MKSLITLVRSHVDKQALDSLLVQLRNLDLTLDQKMEDVRSAQQSVSVWDRINVFTNSDAEQELKEENREYTQIRNEHAAIVENIKNLIRTALYKDYRVALKLQATEVMKAASALRVEHKWGFGGKSHEYQVGGIAALRERITQLATTINSEYGLPSDAIDAEELLNLVYDDVLREGGFIQ